MSNIIELTLLNFLNGEVSFGIFAEHVELFIEDVFDPSAKHHSAYQIVFGFIFFKLAICIHIRDGET